MIIGDYMNICEMEKKIKNLEARITGLENELYYSKNNKHVQYPVFPPYEPTITYFSTSSSEEYKC